MDFRVTLYSFWIFSFLLITTICTYGEIPQKFFAPYVDVNISNFNLTSSIDETGIVYYHLAFMLDEGGCSPAWGESIPLQQNYMYDEIQTVRSRGGDVIISFGGSLGTDLAIGCDNDTSLKNAYQAVINQYEVNYLDFDVEGAAITDYQSVDMRNKAIASLQKDNPGLKISYTIPVLPSGLVDSGFNLLQNAIQNGVNIYMVNIMTMNYGDANAPSPEGFMGQYAVDSAVSTIEQLDQLGLYDTQLGITPMVGQNQIESEVFYLSDGDDLIQYIENESRIGLLSMWSTTRDFGTCPGQTTASPVCSGIEQNDYDFTYSFSTLGNNLNQRPSVSIVAPAADEEFTKGDNINLEAEASDMDGIITKVEFYINSEITDTVSAPPYITELSGLSAGNYELEVIAYDNEGAFSVAKINITVTAYNECPAPLWSPVEIYKKGDEVSYNGILWRAKWWTQNEIPGTTGEWGVWEQISVCSTTENTAPQITITNPFPGSVYYTGESVTIQTMTSDTDGYVTKVEFFNGDILLGTATSMPFEMALDNLPEGSYSFTAIATDDQDKTTESDPVSINVVSNNTVYCSDYQQWENRTEYINGEMFIYGNEIYKVLSTSYNIKPKRGLASGNYVITGTCE